MNIKKHSTIQTWDGRTGEVIDILSKKANVLFSDGSRDWVGMDKIVACENPRHSRAFVQAKAKLRKKRALTIVCDEGDKASTKQIESVLDNIDVDYTKKESKGKIGYEVDDTNTNALAKIRQTSWRPDISIQGTKKFAPGKVDEDLWDEAKKKVKKQRDKNINDFTDRDWGLVNHIYQNMGGTFKSKSVKKQGNSLGDIESYKKRAFLDMELEEAEAIISELKSVLSEKGITGIDFNIDDMSEDGGEGISFEVIFDRDASQVEMVYDFDPVKTLDNISTNPDFKDFDEVAEYESSKQAQTKTSDLQSSRAFFDGSIYTILDMSSNRVYLAQDGFIEDSFYEEDIREFVEDLSNTTVIAGEEISILKVPQTIRNQIQDRLEDESEITAKKISAQSHPISINDIKVYDRGTNRKVVHFLDLVTEEIEEETKDLGLDKVERQWQKVLTQVKPYGGKSYHNPDFGGGISFPSIDGIADYLRDYNLVGTSTLDTSVNTGLESEDVQAVKTSANTITFQFKSGSLTYKLNGDYVTASTSAFASAVQDFIPHYSNLVRRLGCSALKKAVKKRANAQKQKLLEGLRKKSLRKKAYRLGNYDFDVHAGENWELADEGQKKKIKRKK